MVKYRYIVYSSEVDSVYFIRKILTPVLSAVLVAAILSSFNESGYFYAVFSVSLLVFLLAGTILSYVFETYVLERIKSRPKLNQYIISISVYSFGGLLAIFMFALIQGNLLEINLLVILMLGVFPALVYYHLDSSIKFVFSKIVAV